ncbi:hypothetical protein C7B67_14400 [filamentous cyanobacterium Phorm 6]|nr:hypothetical protein C7B67_14400 [filamentous cyanobacterium Phorm 6]
MYKSKLSKVIVSLLRRIAGVTRSGAKRLMRAMLQALMAMGRRARLPVAGFVLPTVTMVLLVVILLTVAIVLRSFDRANMARNVRVNQQVLAAATPALDRAKAKIDYILVGKGKTTASTPSDKELYRAMSVYPANPTATDPDLYTFGDEKRLILKFPVNNGTSLTSGLDVPTGPLTTGKAPNITESEAINTAWRYPVDTNNDGLYDTFTLYGIYFRTPQTERSRKPLDARARPMRLGNLNPACTQGEGTVASLVGDSGWERIGGKFQKSFFVYTVNVPITTDDIQVNGLDNTYQAFKGTSSISALEYQQDQSRIPLSNNAVVYEDDLDISPGPPLNLNGRIMTNSNLLVGGIFDPKSVTLFQVSSKNSCFYDRENSKIVVGGNVINGSASSTAVQPVNVHLFKSTNDTAQPDADGLQIKPGNQSVDTGKTSLDVMYNNQAYSNRLDALVGETPPANDPVAVSQAKNQTREQALEDYFKELLPKVPFAEAPLGTDGGAAAATPPFEGSGDISLRPKDSLNWTPNGPTATVGNLTQPGGIKLLPTQLKSRKPDTDNIDSEEYLGERIVVGNNLPVKRWDGTKFLGINDTQQVDGTTKWEGETGTAKDAIRTRTPQVTKLGDVGATDRGNGTGEEPTTPFKDGFWEQAAAEIPTTFLDSVGGLRVITSAGVYDRTNSFLPPPKWINVTDGKTLKADADTYDDPATPSPAVEKYPVVWPDSMPMSPLGPGSRVFNNSSVPVSGIAAGDWGNWDPAWSSAGVGLPDPQDNSPNFVKENATAKQFAKGDLRMRATAVYHYAAVNTPVPAAGAQLDQTPFACVSSYYDPSTASTARNIEDLDDVSGEGSFLIKSPDGDVPRVSPDVIRGTRQKFIGSNNGITYGPPGARPGRSNLDKNTGLLSGGDPILTAQANFVFPDGRFANGPLRTALQVEPTQRTLAQNSAIDSTNCALNILKGATAATDIPNGAIQEVAFLNGREIKAIDRDDETTIVNEAFTLSSPDTQPAKLTGNYNQSLEERQPLEIRATQLNLGALRGQKIAATTNAPAGEWLLPYSGIIYASRDDALPDRSDRSTDAEKSKRLSPSDYRLDPTRKPNGIVLINGSALFRGGATPTETTILNDIVKEKGLTLVSNLPAYIKGNFNKHGNVPPVKPGDPPLPFKAVEEFSETVTTPDWGNFYTRDKKLNPDFACRKGDPRLPDCGGDYWRQANVLADAVTLLSDNYRFGFRNEGDFDLRNNAGAAAVLPRRQQGFFNNNFVTNGLSSGAFSDNGNLLGTTGATTTPLTDANYVTPPAPPLWSSYFNNFVTPVQRRGKFPEYVMEACRKLPVSECGDDDWFVDFSTTPPKTAAAKGTTYVAPVTGASFQAGSTVDPPLPELQRFPRRVAFKRTNAAPPVLNTPNDPLPLAITNAVGDIVAGGVGRTASDNALWLAGKNGANVAYDASLPYQLNNSNTQLIDGSKVPLPTVVGTIIPALPAVPVVPVVTALPTPPTAYEGSQPLLIPVLQLMNVTKADLSPPKGQLSVQQTAWIPQAEVKGTTFNLIIAAGDTPSRALDSTNGDFNGGLQNLPRFLEAWSNDNANASISTNIQGSFIQQNRSAFSTAPYLPILPTNFPATSADRLASLFALSPTAPPSLERLTTYNIQGSGRFSYFTPPTRNWGYDVGLLSQSPDLFTQKFTTPPTNTQPAEYFREVGRDDEWVKTLMCGVQDDGKVATSSRPNKDCFPPS